MEKAFLIDIDGTIIDTYQYIYDKELLPINIYNPLHTIFPTVQDYERFIRNANKLRLEAIENGYKIERSLAFINTLLHKDKSLVPILRSDITVDQKVYDAIKDWFVREPQIFEMVDIFEYDEHHIVIDDDPVRIATAYNAGDQIYCVTQPWNVNLFRRDVIQYI